MRFRNFIFPTVLVILFSACDEKKAKDKDPVDKQDTKTANASKLEGAWEIKRAEGSMAETNVGTVYEFRGDKLSFGKGSFTNPGTTIITDSTFTFQADGNEFKFDYKYRMNGDTLVVEMQGNSGQTFYLVKK